MQQYHILLSEIVVTVMLLLPLTYTVNEVWRYSSNAWRCTLSCVCAGKGLSLGHPVGFVPGTDEAFLGQVAGREGYRSEEGRRWDKGERGAEQQGSKLWGAEE